MRISDHMKLCCCVAALARLSVQAADVHSYARPDHVRVRHVDLDLDVDFAAQRLRGTATLTVERTSKDATQPLVLDSRKLAIEKVETSADGKAFAPGRFAVGPEDAILGSPVTIPLPANATAVRIHYATGPQASGLQWLTREMTAAKRQPFLFTQSEAIHARSWIPLQDSPAVRVTYSARVRTPPGVVAVMSAEAAAADREFRFTMKQPIPPYLIALAVGELEFRPLGPRTGVYAEPGVVAKAAGEFADLEAMVAAVERLYGPYRWGRYDVLVLPPSFPFGGMENPRLTFASPTVLAGDKSLVSLLAHELAHSWSGNLVSNATWGDFWLNEGFTVYLERRVLEAVYGTARADMEAVLGRRSLGRELADLKLSDQVLHIDLQGRDPDDGLTDIPYEKGALFLKHLEVAFGRPRFDAFLKGYFDHFAFRSITTADFRAYLEQQLLRSDPAAAAKVPVDEWLTKPGLPGTAPDFRAKAFEAVEQQAKAWAGGATAAKDLRTAEWSTQEWQHFLEELPAKLTSERMKELDAAFGLTRRTNAGGVPVVATGGASRLRGGVPAGGGVPDDAGPAEVPEAVVRGVGEDAGRRGAGTGDLREGQADVPPDCRGDRGRHSGGQVAAIAGLMVAGTLVCRRFRHTECAGYTPDLATEPRPGIGPCAVGSGSATFRAASSFINVSPAK
ncbi:MAG: M1 family aminopeptidase [Gemmataceae bacterium]